MVIRIFCTCVRRQIAMLWRPTGSCSTKETSCGGSVLKLAKSGESVWNSQEGVVLFSCASEG